MAGNFKAYAVVWVMHLPLCPACAVQLQACHAYSGNDRVCCLTHACSEACNTPLLCPEQFRVSAALFSSESELPCLVQSQSCPEQVRVRAAVNSSESELPCLVQSQSCPEQVRVRAALNSSESELPCLVQSQRYLVFHVFYQLGYKCKIKCHFCFLLFFVDY